MKTSEQISSCTVCEGYARSKDPKEWQELYNIAWLKIRERELREPNWKADYHKTYFYRVLGSCQLDLLKKKSNRLEFMPDELPDIEQENHVDIWEVEIKSLNYWRNKKPDNKTQAFLQDIVFILLKCKNVKHAAQEAKMSKRSFADYLREAKNDIDYEYFILTDSHPLNNNDLL